jgi:hypothetical protein
LTPHALKRIVTAAETYRGVLSMQRFPFNLDPAEPVPEPELKVTIIITNVGRASFPNPRQALGSLVGVTYAMHTGKEMITADIRKAMTVTGWDPLMREVTVVLNI